MSGKLLLADLNEINEKDPIVAWKQYKSYIRTTLKLIGYNEQDSDLYDYLRTPKTLIERLAQEVIEEKPKTTEEKVDNALKALAHCAKIAVAHIPIAKQNISQEALDSIANYRTTLRKLLHPETQADAPSTQNVINERQEDQLNVQSPENDEESDEESDKEENDAASEPEARPPPEEDNIDEENAKLEKETQKFATYLGSKEVQRIDAELTLVRQQNEILLKKIEQYESRMKLFEQLLTDLIIDNKQAAIQKVLSIAFKSTQ